jgi:hypothetical protein
VGHWFESSRARQVFKQLIATAEMMLHIVAYRPVAQRFDRMDFGTFIVRLVEALAWPTVVLVVFWTLRGQVGALVGRIRRLKWKDAEAAFSEELDKAEEKVPPPPPTEKPSDMEEQRATAQLPPAYIVQQAWLRVEHALGAASDQLGLSPTARLNYAKRLQRLNLSPEEADLLRQLRALRNQAVHSQQPDITVTDALRYKDLAESLAHRIEESRKD